jgi:hypothetical protein
MKRTLLISVAALALTAGGNLAYAQTGGGAGGGAGAGAGAGGTSPMANPAAPTGGANVNQDVAPGTKAPAKAAQDRGTQDKKATQQAPSTKQSADDKAGAPATKQTQDGKSGQPSTTQQSQDGKSGQPGTTKQTQDGKSGQPGTTKQTQDGKSGQPGTTTQQQTQSPATGGSKQGASGQTGSNQQGAGGSMTSKSVSLTTEQKTTIRTTVLTSSAPRVTNVNFDVRVGVAVPRTVRIAPLPATIISIEPEWRGYMYFVYNDEIIVVEPRTLQIVAVLQV